MDAQAHGVTRSPPRRPRPAGLPWGAPRMTVSLGPVAPQSTRPAAGSRAARLLVPRSVDVVRQLAAGHGVCTRPVTLRRTNLDTGRTELIDLPCGATREDRCASCAKRAQRLRQQ